MDDQHNPEQLWAKGWQGDYNSWSHPDLATPTVTKSQALVIQDYADGPDIDADKWTKRFLNMARLVGSWSKDPSTKLGAVIVRPDRTIVSVGYNGFPRGMCDHPELYENRETKYERVVHAEMNACLTANENIDGCTIYTWPFLPCARCCTFLIQIGIEYVVSIKPTPEQEERWSLQSTRDLFREAAVTVTECEVNPRRGF